jgi:hypothetical protein
MGSKALRHCYGNTFSLLCQRQHVLEISDYLISVVENMWQLANVNQ